MQANLNELYETKYGSDNLRLQQGTQLYEHYAQMPDCIEKHHVIHNLTVKERVKLSWISKSKPVGFDNEEVINHQKPINSWLAKALMSPYILSKLSNFESGIAQRLSDMQRSNFQS